MDSSSITSNSVHMKSFALRRVVRTSVSFAAALCVLASWGCDRDRVSADAPIDAAQSGAWQQSDRGRSEERFSARVISITDGDTIDVLVDRQPMTIRLAEIDAPERRQPWGTRSRQALGDLIAGETVEIMPTDEDRWQRVVGRVYLDGRDINLAMVELGAAWAFLRYQTDPQFSTAEEEAREASRGLWSMPPNETIPPWEWRDGRRTAQPPQRADGPAVQGLYSQPSAPAADPSDYRCGERRFCPQMRSCEEAQFHLQQCGLTTIDGDNDGVPCDVLCGG